MTLKRLLEEKSRIHSDESPMNSYNFQVNGNRYPDFQPYVFPARISEELDERDYTALPPTKFKPLQRNHFKNTNGYWDNRLSHLIRFM